MKEMNNKRQTLSDRFTKLDKEYLHEIYVERKFLIKSNEFYKSMIIDPSTDIYHIFSYLFY